VADDESSLMPPTDMKTDDEMSEYDQEEEDV
jgi:hypothetical protein